MMPVLQNFVGVVQNDARPKMLNQYFCRQSIMREKRTTCCLSNTHKHKYHAKSLLPSSAETYLPILSYNYNLNISFIYLFSLFYTYFLLTVTGFLTYEKNCGSIPETSRECTASDHYMDKNNSVQITIHLNFSNL